MAASDDYVEMSATYLIDAIRMGKPRGPMHKKNWETAKKHMYGEEGIMNVASRSKKFSFGELRRFDIHDPEYKNDASYLSETAQEFFKNGIPIAPYPDCWMEWDLSKFDSSKAYWERRVGKVCALVSQEKDLLAFHRFGNFSGGCDARSLRNGWEISKFQLLFSMDGEWRYVNLDEASNEQPNVEDWNSAMAALGGMAMLLSRDAKVIDRHPPAGLNAHRIKKGKVPLFSHHVVTIDPHRIVYEGDGSEPSGIKRASPRLHWRRGHVRTLSSGKKVGVPPCIIGAKPGGGGGPVIDKTYRVTVWE